MPKDSSPITPALHGSGVVSRSPYPGAYSTPSKPLSREFIHKWVIPFYMAINAEETEKLAPKVRQVLPELTPEVVEMLFAHLDWRPRQTGAWFAALMDWRQFETTIGELLLRSEVCYAGRVYCIALASFETPEAADYLKRYLDFYLRRPECWYDQGEAIAALCWLDAKHGSNQSSAFQELWSEFIVNKQNWDLERSKSLFSGWMQHLAQMRLALQP